MGRNKLFLVLIIFGCLFYYFYKPSENRPVIAPSATVVKKEVEALSLAFLRINGKVTIEKNGISSEATEELILSGDCKIKTSKDSYAILVYGQGIASKIKIGPDTTLDIRIIKLDPPGQGDALDIDLLHGDLLLKIFNPTKKIVLNVKTKAAVMKVRGTTFFIRADESRSLLFVKEGVIQLESYDSWENVFVYQDSGYKITNSEALKVAFNQYNINWEFNELGMVLANKDISTSINTVLEKMKNEIADMYSSLARQKVELDDLKKSNDLELSNMEEDVKCVSRTAEDCVFKSIAFSKDILFNRGKKKNILVASDSEGLLSEVQKFKDNLIVQLSTKNHDVENYEKSIKELEFKFSTASAKFNQVKDLADGSDDKVRKVLIKELVDILENGELSIEYNEMNK